MRPQQKRDVVDLESFLLKVSAGDLPEKGNSWDSQSARCWIPQGTIEGIDEGIRTSVTQSMAPIAGSRGRLSWLLETREKLKSSLKWVKSAKSAQSGHERVHPSAARPAAYDGYVLAHQAGEPPLWIPTACHTPPAELSSVASLDMYFDARASHLVGPSGNVLANQVDSEWQSAEWLQYFGPMPTADGSWTKLFLSIPVRRATFASFLEMVRRAALRVLRRVNDVICPLLRKLERLQRLNEFLARNRSFLLLHGAHPPRLMEFGVGSINLPGVPA